MLLCNSAVVSLALTALPPAGEGGGGEREDNAGRERGRERREEGIATQRKPRRRCAHSVRAMCAWCRLGRRNLFLQYYLSTPLFAISSMILPPPPPPPPEKNRAYMRPRTCTRCRYCTCRQDTTGSSRQQKPHPARTSGSQPPDAAHRRQGTEARWRSRTRV